jgi:hypothetical protein
MLLETHHPKQFVITSDRDFQRVLNSPDSFGAKYLLVPGDGTLVNLDAINRLYPTLARDGAGVVSPQPAKEFRVVGCPLFRLYKVTHIA